MSAGDVGRLIDRALDFVAVSADRAEEVMIGDDFQIKLMHGALTLWDLFSEESPLHLRGEMAQELAGWLGRAQRYADTDDWPEGFEDPMVSIDGGPPTYNEDVAWVHYSNRAGRAAACVTLYANSIGTTTTATGNAAVHFVSDDVGRKRYWRDMIVLEGDNLESLVCHAPHAYPDLHFVDGVITHADHLSGGYLASRQRVRAALAALNDWGHWTFTWPPPAIAPGEAPLHVSDAQPSHQLVEHRFTGFGLNAAPEKPNVRDHRVSREAREIVLGGRTLYCEWHVKLEPHRNRIHFHAPVPESGDRVVIGMITEHLPLP
ncbi:hypothetical protein [Mesorhizobium sp. M0809]